MPPESNAAPLAANRPTSLLALALWAGLVTGFCEVFVFGVELLLQVPLVI
jgi:hypothetical protein